MNIIDTAIHGNRAYGVRRLAHNFLPTPSSWCVPLAVASTDCFDTALVGRNFEELINADRITLLASRLMASGIGALPGTVFLRPRRKKLPRTDLS